MDFPSLVTHGLSAISVFSEVVGVRLLIGTLSGTLGAILGILTVAVLWQYAKHGPPGWYIYAVGVLSIIVMQLVTIVSGFTLFMLSGRTAMSFVPCRDAPMFVKEVVNIYPND
jgi:hypothetical protein